ncbi:hypothetical protein MKK88_09560 [Methylobacterium sp. E-005]|uniref:ribbon-helix-helix domain-containing protein n=1 Tax=Methylobacterium sp. E-005 TaxID=2836549 RepID=UPI001FBA782D|nr:ribbon-helix-helix domain-containing protein [Methylobacterium sp. E-005]MCJ2086240.1 hypothetical protein [Methylobacterium sp. E-005]
MSKPARGSLASMAVPKAVSSSAAPAVSTPAAEAPRQEASQPAEPTPRRAPVDMKTVQVRINKAGWKALRDLGDDNDKSLEALMVEALNDVLLKYKKPPVVQRRVGERGQERGE